MKRFLLLALTAGLSFPAFAEVDPKVHKMCLAATDYIGCIKAQSGNFGSKEIITNPGTATNKGNSCPNGYAYVGEGYCREVTCTYGGGKNEALISGNKWKCLPIGIFIKEGTTLGFGPALRIGNNPDCPSGEPKKGWTSTCEKPYEEPPKDQRIFGRRVKK